MKTPMARTTGRHSSLSVSPILRFDSKAMAVYRVERRSRFTNANISFNSLWPGINGVVVTIRHWRHPNRRN